MNRTFLRFALMSMIAVSVFTACSKDDNKETPVTVTDVTPTEVAVGGIHGMIYYFYLSLQSAL